MICWKLMKFTAKVESNVLNTMINLKFLNSKRKGVK